MRLFLAATVSLLAFRPTQQGQGESSTDRLLDLIERRHREAADPGDARAAAGRLGFDRAKILEFVRTEIAWEPYAGILRDAPGTLLVRAGNSVDRALLLQAMLESGGEKTRLMRVDLTEADGAKLLEGFRKRERRPRSIHHGPPRRNRRLLPRCRSRWTTINPCASRTPRDALSFPRWPTPLHC